MINHTPGQPFSDQEVYSVEALTQTMRAQAKKGRFWIYASVYFRMEELGMTMTELIRCLTFGDVVSFEVTPSKWEIRLKAHHAAGDCSELYPVVWIDRNLDLYCADIRDA